MPRDLDPGTGRRKFSKLARRMLRPTTATRVSSVHRCANGPLHKRPSYRALRSWTTPVVAVLNQRGSTGKTTFLCSTKKFGFTRMSRGSRVQMINSALRPMPGAGRRNFPKLARRVLDPTTATRVSSVHRCANGPLHKRPSYRALRSWTTPVVAVLNQKGSTGKTTFLCSTKKFGFTRMSRGSRVQMINSAPQAIPGARRRNFPNLRGVRFIRRRQPGYHWCADVQVAFCTNSHHI